MEFLLIIYLLVGLAMGVIGYSYGAPWKENVLVALLWLPVLVVSIVVTSIWSNEE